SAPGRAVDLPATGRQGGVAGGREEISARREVAQDVAQDAAVAVVGGLGWGVEADDGAELPGLPVALGADRHLVGHAVAAVQAGEGVDLLAGQAEGLRGLAGLELQREHAYPDEVRPVDAFVGG